MATLDIKAKPVSSRSSHRERRNAATLFAGFSDHLATRVVKGFFDETRRRVQTPKYRPRPEFWDPSTITAAWLGHSSVLLNFYGVHILTDPVLFRRIGVRLGMGTVGPKRLVAPALKVRQLPSIDLIVLSHAHMDHLDMPTLRCFKSSTQVVTAKNTADILARTRLKKVTELGWGEQSRIETRHGALKVEAFEVKHWGARWRHDRHRGYNGYILEREGKKLIFGGDTAWSTNFKDLRDKGPFEMAIMPIGAYKPFTCSHCTPEQAVEMANQAGAKYFLPIHHRTFTLGKEDRHEPMQRLEAALESDRIALRDVGETFLTS